MRLSVRARLTAWYSVVLLATLILFSGLGYGFARAHVRAVSDASLRGTLQTFRSAMMAEVREDAADSAASMFREVAADFRYSSFTILVLDSGDRPIASSLNRSGLPTDVSGPLMAAARSPGLLLTLRAGNPPMDHRALIATTIVRNQSYPTIILRSLADEQKILDVLWRAYGIAIPIALLLSATGGYLLARRGMAPVAAMAATAERIGSRNLDERLSEQGPADELGRLARVLNDLLSRLQNAFEQQKRFLADASHELRTPMTIIRGESSVALSRERSAEEYREALEIVNSEATHLTGVVENLFLLARGEAESYPAERGPMEIGALLADCVHSLRSQAADGEVTLEVDASAPLVIMGAEDLCRRLFVNLLDNAIRHTRPGGTVAVRAIRRGGLCEISFRDEGPGIPEFAREHLFDRFYRVARDSRSGGAGLGLAIVRWIAELHGGSVRLETTSAEGSTFVVEMPLEPEASDRPGTLSVDGG